MLILHNLIFSIVRFHAVHCVIIIWVCHFWFSMQWKVLLWSDPRLVRVTRIESSYSFFNNKSEWLYFHHSCFIQYDWLSTTGTETAISTQKVSYKLLLRKKATPFCFVCLFPYCHCGDNFLFYLWNVSLSLMCDHLICYLHSPPLIFPVCPLTSCHIHLLPHRYPGFFIDP